MDNKDNQDPHEPINPEDNHFYEDETLEEVSNKEHAEQTGEANARRHRIFIAIAALLALVLVGGLFYKFILQQSASGFRAPIPREPVDVGDKDRDPTEQPIDYADAEGVRTMNYDKVNDVYGLPLAKQQQQADRRQAGTDAAGRINPSVKREEQRSQKLSRTSSRRSGEGTSSVRRQSSDSDDYPAAREARNQSAYGNSYRANPTKDELMLRAGFNTVKAEKGGGGTANGSFTSFQQALPDVADEEPIPGVVNGDQVARNGTRVMFRTLADAHIRDRFAPKGSILLGFARIGGDRIVFSITTLRLQATGEAVPVQLRALDIDMNEGLALQSDRPLKQQTDRAVDNASSQALSRAAWSAGYSANQALRLPGAAGALATLGTGLAQAATNGRRREARQKIELQDGFKVFFTPVK
ncbi:MAG: hypothetical protein JWP57_282 [Spirosoma sp.]|nr:hypothetical protein [Spirosoma sp.]